MKKYEFSYVDDNKEMHFVTVFDNDLLSACERVLCRPVVSTELTHSINGLHFVNGWVDTNFAIKELEYQPISHHVAYTPTKINPLLAGLV